ncbi:hypothetical protein [Endozoicomonas sp. SCSIO W0465]|uniref:hypothetical protein n=1 Tax=Endozoicomonas sp. SCSIO W0465 TaxID=2918516 RepID=UPI0020751FE8|nr:hypothetical protein [Endozoicomonas sp. SCSIO W0465]USE36577.1 hypothetical protein MJO57_31980 [Endozoicomonas sp. SCSIO W0465]
MSQSNISGKNIARLHKLKLSTNLRVAGLADIALAVARVKPHKKTQVEGVGQRAQGAVYESQ